MVKKNKLFEFSIIGAGRFGLFWGKHLSAYYSTSFYDIHPGSKKNIAENGKWQTLKQCLQKDYIFLTLPIGQIPLFLEKNAAMLKKGSVVVDCASVKKPVVDWFEKYIPPEVFYTASHPLFGPDSARNGLQDHLLLLIPGRIPLDRYDFLLNLFRDRFRLEVVSMSADEHDRLMAYNLTLVHHLGRTLEKLGITRLPLRMAGLKKLCEISQVVMNDSEELFNDFYRLNPYSAPLRESFLSAFTRLGRD
jgi:prephenate dehydrogenase